MDSYFFRQLLQNEILKNATANLGSAIKNLGLFSKSPGDFRIEKKDFYSSLGRSTPGVLLPRLP